MLTKSRETKFTVRPSFLALILFATACVSCGMDDSVTAEAQHTLTPELTMESSHSTSVPCNTPLPEISLVAPTTTNSLSIKNLQSGLYVVSVSERGLRVRDLQGHIHLEIPTIDDPAASISPDGKFILYRGPNSSTLKLINLESMAERKFGESSDLFFGGTSWSPDGLKVAFEAIKKTQEDVEDEGSLYLLDILTREIKQITFWPRSEWDPSWSPDGRWIAFASDKHSDIPQPGESDIYVLDTACLDDPKECTNHIRRLSFLSPEEKAYSPNWANDSKNLVYVCIIGSKIELCALNIDSGSSHQISPSIENSSRPIWSPDGEWIVYTHISYESPHRRAFIIRPDGTGEKQVSDMENEDVIGWILVK